MCPGRGIDEVSRDADPVWGFANAPFQHVAPPKLGPDLLHVDGAPLECETRVAGDDEQRLETRQRRDDVLDHSISEVGLSGRARAGFDSGETVVFDSVAPEIANTCTGRVMFFSAISPLSSIHTLIRSRT